MEFEWFKGFSIEQKIRNIKALHEKFKSKYPDRKILEISTKSTEELGRKLSSMNLRINLSLLLKDFNTVRKEYKLDREIFRVEAVYKRSYSK